MQNLDKVVWAELSRHLPLKWMLFNLVMLLKSEYGYVIWGQQKWDTLAYGEKKH